MGEVIRLHVHKNKRSKRLRKETRDTLLSTAKQLRRHVPIDGYVLGGFTINPAGNISHHVHFDVPTASLTYVLPQMAQQAILSALQELEDKE